MTNKDTLRVIIAGGGTGGHIFPALAIAKALQRLLPGVQLLFVGAKGKMEMEKIPQQGFKIIGLDIDGFKRGKLFENILLPFKLIKSRIEADKIIKDFNPNVIVGVGGYASFPVMAAGQNRKIPTLIQEQNSFAGKSNMILGRNANIICVAYQKMDQFFPKAKIVYTGNPVRHEIANMACSKQEALHFFGLSNEKKTLLIIGGSLGAQSINDAIYNVIGDIINEGLQVIWQTGKNYYDKANQKAIEVGENVKVEAFIQKMDYAYTAADFIVSRAGALAIAEICIAGKPVVFVPYPHAAEDHQTNNAMELVQLNAAMIVKDNEVKTELLKKIKLVVNDIKMQEIMADNLKRLAIKDADEQIAKKIIEIAKV